MSDPISASDPSSPRAALPSLSTLAGLSLFADFEESEIEPWVDRFTERRVETGEYLYREGQTADTVHGLVSGSVAIFREAVGVPVQLLDRAQPGELVGHVCIFADSDRLASARATSPSHLVSLGKEDFEALLDSRPDLYARLEEEVTEIHSARLAAILELEKSKEVRMRVSYEAELELEDGQRSPVLVDNLSIGGFCVRGAPESWVEGSKQRFRLILPAGPLDLAGRVAWSRGGDCGMAFHQMSKNHDTLVQMAVHLLLEIPAPAGTGPAVGG